MGNPFQLLERIFTEPGLGRTVLLLTVVTVVILLDYSSGLTNHYDISSQISHLNKVEEAVEGDSTLASKADSLKAEVLNQIEQHQEIEVSPTEAVWLVGLFTAVLILLVYIRLLLVGSEVLNEPRETARPTTIAMLFCVAAVALPWFAHKLWPSISVAKTTIYSGILNIFLILIGLLILASISVDEEPGDLEVEKSLLQSTSGTFSTTEGSQANTENRAESTD